MSLGNESGQDRGGAVSPSPDKSPQLTSTPSASPALSDRSGVRMEGKELNWRGGGGDQRGSLREYIGSSWRVRMEAEVGAI